MDRTTTRTARWLLVLTLVGLWGCFGERRGLSRDALEKSLTEPLAAPVLPSLEQLVVLRYPAPGDGGADAPLPPCLVAWARRDYDELLIACGDEVERDPASPRAVAAARVLLRAKPGDARAGARLAERGPGWVEQCRKRRGACADLARVVADERAERAAVAKDAAAFAAAVKDSGRLRQARIEGPFAGDASRLLDAESARRELPRHAVAWRTWEQVSADGFFSPAAGGSAGVYRLAFTVSGRGRVTALLTGAHTLRARVDGVVVAERHPEELPGAVTRVGLELSSGAHRVELLALSLGGADRISLALLDDSGTPLLETAEAPRQSAKVEVGPARGAVEALAVDPAQATLESILWRVAVARSPALTPRADEPLVLGRALVQRFGGSPVALAMAAEILGEEASVPSRVSSSAAAALWQRVLVAWPDHPVARITAARNAREERPDQALAAYRRLVVDKPRYAFGLREGIDQLLDVGALDEARELTERLLVLEPSAENLDAALPALRALGDHARAAELERTRAGLDASFSRMREARLELEGLHRDRGVALLAESAAAEPHGPAPRELLLLTALTDPAAALHFASQAAAARPDDAALVVRRIELMRAVHGDDAARRALLDALPRLRDHEGAAQAAERLGVPTWWAERDLLASEVLAHRRAQPQPFREHAAVALLDDVERVLFEDTSSLVLRHLIIELSGKEVLDRFGELPLGGARALRARVHKPDGRFAEAERHAGVDDLSLPDLAPGDVVELLTMERDGAAPWGGTFETRALDGVPTPALSRRYQVSFPEGFDRSHGLQIIATHGLPPPVRERFLDAEGRPRVRLGFALADVAAEPGEPFSPAAAETARSGGFAWGVDDELWATLRGTAIERAARGDAWLEEAARAIAGAGEPAERLARVFAFVARRIEPADSPDDAVSVLLLGQGERTPLLLALLRAAGLDAAPVALQPTTQPDPSVPDGNAWRLLGVRVRIGEREHFALVDGNAVLDRLPRAARASHVLDLSTRPRGARRSVLPDSALDTQELGLQASLSVESGGGAARMGGVVVITLPAAGADGARRALRRATPEQARALVEAALSPSLPGVEVAEVRTPGLEAAGEALRLGATISVPLHAGEDGAVRFEHLFANGVGGALQISPGPATYLAVPERRRPLLVLEDAEHLELELALPRGALFVEAPPHRSDTAGPFSLEQRVEVTDGRLSWRREIRRQSARVPVQDWPSTAAALAGMAGHLDARLGFVLAGSKQEPR